MIRALAVVLALVAAAAATADPIDFPALYRVAGVAADDRLNVRQGPGADTPVIATLAPGARDVEVLGAERGGRWLRLNSDAGPGYAAARFLARQAGQDPSEMPLPLFCSGAEPFWSLRIGRRGRAELDGADLNRHRAAIDWSGPAAARAGMEYGARLTGADGRIHLVLQRQFCTDGMSDRDFGLKIDAIVTGGGPRGPFMLTGCCALAR